MTQPEDISGEFNRRDFLKGSSVATLLTMLGGAPLFAQAPAAPQGEPSPPPPKVKIALIGLGPWGREILDQLGRLERADIAAICDNYPAAYKKSASKAPQAAQVEDYKTVLANKDIQAVIVATGTHQHKDIVIEALKAGKHVYCEMPLANTAEDAKAIALAAKNAVGKFFQCGLQMRCDPQRHWLIPVIRSGALGKAVQARAQWHKKHEWRFPSPNPDREKAINWRLDKNISLGLPGEIAIHQLDQAGWFFANALPVAISGRGSIVLHTDGRTVADTIDIILEYPGGVRLMYDCTLANSFDGDYEIYSGSYAAVMLRDSPTQAWIFKEGDSPQFGWEVYARKDNFYKETGIVLMAGASKQEKLGGAGAATSAFPHPSLYYALEAFLINCTDTDTAVEDFKANYPTSTDPAALKEFLAAAVRPSGNEVSVTAAALENVVRRAPRQDEGYAATMLALKASEAITTGQRIELKKEWFELA